MILTFGVRQWRLMLKPGEQPPEWRGGHLRARMFLDGSDDIQELAAVTPSPSRKMPATGDLLLGHEARGTAALASVDVSAGRDGWVAALHFIAYNVPPFMVPR